MNKMAKFYIISNCPKIILRSNAWSSNYFTSSKYTIEVDRIIVNY